MGKASFAERFRNAEDGSFYDVWHLIANGNGFVLKKAKGKEKEIYRAFFSRTVSGVPKFYGSAVTEDGEFLLLSYIPGEPLLNVGRNAAAAAIDALVGVQEEFWLDTAHSGCGTTFEESLRSRTDRGKYLADSALERCYRRFLEIYRSQPRTLCHDDLLPFNVLYDGERAAIVDWEHAGVLPYMTSVARLLAHATEDAELFRMTDPDKEYCIDRYYESFVKQKGIERARFMRELEFFIFYEYCEWVMLGNKYPSSATARNRRYNELAKALAQKLLNE